MVETNLDTLKYINIPIQIKGYDLIQDQLSLVEKRLVAEQSDQNNLFTDAAVQLFDAGGKRIRAVISLLSAGIFEADHERSISLAAGVEMLHTATLVHDDLIDGSVLRRGKPTLNAGQHAKLSVLIGDYLFARAANLVAETENLDIMNQFARTLMTILNGEMNQQTSRWQVDRRDYFDRIYAKTGVMFVLAAQSGARLGGADEQELIALEKYGYYTGIAFQIVDDVLDFTAQQSQLGKPVGSDLRQGIFTLPVLRYVDQYPNDPNFKLLLDVQDGNHPAAAGLIGSIRASGVIAEALEEARELVANGQRALKDLPNPEYVDSLASLADGIIERKS
jgi:geranylgeranyl pyrophosphate synthase